MAPEKKEGRSGEEKEGGLEVNEKFLERKEGRREGKE